MLIKKSSGYNQTYMLDGVENFLQVKTFRVLDTIIMSTYYYVGFVIELMLYFCFEIKFKIKLTTMTNKCGFNQKTFLVDYMD